MEDIMEKEKNILIMVILNMKENIQMVNEKKEKNIIIMVT